MRRKALSSRSKRSVSMRKSRDKKTWKEGVEIKKTVERRRGKGAWKEIVERRREGTVSPENAHTAQGSDAVPWPGERYVEAMTLRANPARLLVHQIASENARDAVRLARSLNGPGAQARCSGDCAIVRRRNGRVGCLSRRLSTLPFHASFPCFLYTLLFHALFPRLLSPRWS